MFLGIIGAMKEIPGVAAAAVHRSHHCGVVGLVVEHLARRGFVALMFANTPKAIAPWGGSAPVFGTNPIAFAAPRASAPPLVVDMSVSKIARGKILLAAEEGRPIPGDWACVPRTPMRTRCVMRTW